MFARSLRLVAAAAAACTVVMVPMTPAGGVAIVIENPGFEAVQVGSGNFSSSAIYHPGWQNVATPGSLNGVAHPPAGDASLAGQVIAGIGMPTEGTQFGWAVNGLGFQQTISSATFDASQTYVLRVDAALSSDSDPSNANAGYIITFALEGGTILGDQLEYSDAEHNISDGAFRTRTITYVGGTLNDANDGRDMIIRFQSANFGGYATRFGAGFDNIRLDIDPIPEPATLAAVVLLAGCFVARRR